MSTQMQPVSAENAAIEHDNRAARAKTIAVTERGLQLSTMQEIIDFCQIVHQSGLAPRGLESPQKLFVACAMGLEIGLSAMQSIQNIGVINGRPSLYGSIALGKVRSSGQLEKISEWIEDADGNRLDTVTTNSPDTVRAVCVVKRVGEDEVRSTFSIAEAKAAGLLSKQGPWQSYRKNMLKYRARGNALADTFSDVLKGIPTFEEQIGNDPIPDEKHQKATVLNNRIQEKLEAAKKKPVAKPVIVPPKPAPEPELEPKKEPEITEPEPVAEVEPEATQAEQVDIPSETEEQPITDKARFKIMRLLQILHPQSWQAELEKLLGQRTFKGKTVSDGERLIAQLQQQVDGIVNEDSASEADQPNIDSDGVIEGTLEEEQG